MGINGEKSLFNQLTDSLSKIDSLVKVISNLENIIKDLSSSVKELKETIIKKDELIEKQQKEIERLKISNKKDSSNSSKPSSTNGFKKVITNRREKSTLKKGGQLNHELHLLDEDKVNDLIDKGATVEIININKNATNENKEYKTIKIIDIEVKTVITEYRYYPDEEGNYDIPDNTIQNIKYGNDIKALAVSLMCQFPNSTDSAKEIISSLTNGGINLSKGSLINWQNDLSFKLSPEIKKIEEELLNSPYINADECSTKVNGEASNMICAATSTHTRFWANATKKHKDLEELGFWLKFLGVIIKDGTDIYNGFGSAFSQCLSHILRYLKGVYDFVDHKAAKEMSEYLKKCIHLRNELISKDVTAFDEKIYNELLIEYERIIKTWKREWMKDKDNPVYEDERKLLSRMEDSDKEQILYFLKDFRVPPTNNQAESDERPIKIRQKIGKPRSYTGADNYAVIRSCVNNQVEESK